MKITGKKLAVVFWLSAAVAWAGGTIDVTDKVVAAAKKNSLSILVDNATMGSDPAVKKVKQLRVEYGVGETVLTNSANEKSTLTIEAPPGKRLIILKATYGAF